MSEKISITKIAEESGYSVSTVSRVINGRAREFRISEKAEKIILNTSKEFNYQPNPIAVNLRVKKSFTIGLVIPGLDNPFFVNITSLLNRELTKKGYNIILTESYEDPQIEEGMITQLLNRNIDALLLIPCNEKDKNLALLEEKFEEGLPIICIDRYMKDSKIPYVTTDNKEGANRGVKYLIERGHTNIACIQGLEGSSPTKDREAGYLTALEEYNLKPFYIGGDEFSVKCGYREMSNLLRKKEIPTAVFAMSSTIALGVMEAVKEYGYSIPEDISLMGFDDNIFLDYLSTPLTTISQPIQEISNTAVKALIDHLDDKVNISEWNSRMLETNLIERKSVSNK